MAQLNAACRTTTSKEKCDLTPLGEPGITLKINGKDCTKTADNFVCGDLTVPLQFKTGSTPALFYLFDPAKQIGQLTRGYLPAGTKAFMNTNDTESAIEESLSALRQFRGLDFIFKGQSYPIGRADVSNTVNQALESNNSSMRLFLSVDDQTNAVALYAPLLSERVIKIGDATIRFTTVGKAKQQIGNFPFHGAFNDRLASVLIRADALQKELSDRKTLPRSPYSYQLPVYRRIQDDFFKKMGGTNDSNLQILAELIVKHEEAHFALEAKYGEEIGFLMRTFVQVGIDNLKMMDELSANLAAVDAIVELSKKDPESAKRAFYALAIYHGPHRQMSAADKSTYDLLLSSAEIKENKVEIDWEKLGEKTASLKKVTEGFFEEFAYGIEGGALVIAGKLNDPRTEGGTFVELRKKYLAYRDEIIKAKYAQVSPPALAKRAASATITDQVKRVGGVNGLQIILAAVFEGNMKVNNWLKTNIGVVDRELPFSLTQ